MADNRDLVESVKDKHINPSEIEFSAFSRVDDVGRVFFWQGRVLRAINHQAVERVKDIFSSGMLDELVGESLFPKSWITDYAMNGYGLVIEHEKNHPITYPYEWSYSMFKDAAITVLAVNAIARKYGYQLKDCHGYNVVFDNTQPKFVDFGSLVRVDSGFTGWVGYEQFLRSYYGPLYIWSSGNYHVARGVLSSESEMPYFSYLLYRFPLLRLMFPDSLRNLTEIYFKLRRLSLMPTTRIRNKFPNHLGGLICYLKDKGLLPFQSIDSLSLIRKIQKIHRKHYRTKWGGYHDEYYDHNGRPISSPRFDRIIDIMKSYDIKSVLEVGGNQGVFSRLLLERTNVDHVICTDYDENAVDLLYLASKNRNLALTPAVLDFITPIVTYHGHYPRERFKSDAVVALAVAHHLVLGQNISIDHVLRTLSMYTKRFVFIEYMPLGLYDGKSIPSVPTWYTLDWFKKSFEMYFRILVVEKLEENRILFVGELISRDSPSPNLES